MGAPDFRAGDFICVAGDVESVKRHDDGSVLVRLDKFEVREHRKPTPPPLSVATAFTGFLPFFKAWGG